jgi:enamine deaminase RidA (YjgF/YER057c/UK114 family)
MIRRIQAGARMSQAIVHGNTVYLAGQVADDPRADIATQTRQVLRSVDRLLASAGTDKTQILHANIFLKDIGNFGEMNKVWDAWVPQGNAPARATVQSALAAPEYQVEIVITAALP